MRFTSFRWGLFAVVALAALSGCKGGPESQLVGKWRFKDIIPPAGLSQAQLAKIEQAYASAKPEVKPEFKSDKSFLLPLPNAPIAGDWSITERSVTLNTKTISGLPPEQYKKAEVAKLKPINPGLAKRMESQPADPGLTGKLSDDGQTLEISPQGGKSATLRFSKQAG